MATEQKKLAQLRRMTRRPSTPGEVVAGLLEEGSLTRTEFAQRLGVSRATVADLIQGRRPLTPDLAHRLGRFFGNGANVWLRMQANVDLWDALHMDTSAYEPIEPFKVAV